MAVMPFPCNSVFIIQGNLPGVILVFTLNYASFHIPYFNLYQKLKKKNSLPEIKKLKNFEFAKKSPIKLLNQFILNQLDTLSAE